MRVQRAGPNSDLFSKDLKYGVPRLSIFKTYRNRNITFDSKIEKNGNVRLKELNVPYIDIVSSLKQFDKGEDTMEANLNGFFSMKSKSQSLSLKPSSTLKRDSIVSILIQKVKAGQRFIRTAPNTFALKDGPEALTLYSAVIIF